MQQRAKEDSKYQLVEPLFRVEIGEREPRAYGDGGSRVQEYRVDKTKSADKDCLIYAMLEAISDKKHVLECRKTHCRSNHIDQRVHRLVKIFAAKRCKQGGRHFGKLLDECETEKIHYLKITRTISVNIPEIFISLIKKVFEEYRDSYHRHAGKKNDHDLFPRLGA